MTKKTTTTELVDAKELAPVKTRITKAESYANGLVIKTDDDQKKATIALSELNKISDEITKRKEDITKPLNAALKSARDLFKPIEAGHAEVVRIIKGKLIAYHDEKVAAEKKEQDKIAARVAKGTLKPETAVRKLDEVAPVEKNVKTEAGALQYKKVAVVRIVKDITNLQDAEILAHAKAGLFKWDEVAAKKAALAIGTEGEVLAGVTLTIETQAANIR